MLEAKIGGRRGDAVQPGPQPRLDVEVLEHRLDDEVRVGGRGEVGRRDEARQRRVAVLGG